jgi:hypothetical protein
MKPVATMPTSLVRRQVGEAVARHAEAAPLIRAVAAELPPAERRPWDALADALARGDLAAGTAAAAADPACWLPLFATPAGDPRLFGRIVAAAGKPARAGESGWPLVALAIGLVAPPMTVLFALSSVVVPMYEGFFEGFGTEPPLVTAWVLAVSRFMRMVWPPFLLAGLLVVGTWAVGRWWIRRGPVVAEAFTRGLADLVAGGVPQDEAIELASGVAGVPPGNPARPRRPLTHAAVAALAYEPAVAGKLLDAVADGHAELAAGSTGTAAGFIGSLAYGLVFLIMLAYMFALFAPQIAFVQDCS